MQLRRCQSIANSFARQHHSLLTTRAQRPLRVIGTTTWLRGAKRKSTINIDDLPQGVLPALPKANSDVVQGASYPRVMQGHLDNVRAFKDCVVLTRVGDFYEMYFDQADEYAAQIGIRLAKRTTSQGQVSMAGFPHTQLDRYLKMFVQDMGKKVALSEQVPIPVHEQTKKSGAALYERQVKRIITPGTLIDESFLAASENNFLLAIHSQGGLPADEQSRQSNERCTVGLGWVDLSSGEFNVQTAALSALPSLIARIGPKEVIITNELQHSNTDRLQKLFGEQVHALSFHTSNSAFDSAEDWLSLLEDDVLLPKDLTIEETCAGSLILDYVTHRLLDANIKLQAPVRRNENEYMLIDKQSLRALEIKATLRDGLLQGSLLNTIRRTVTNSGARLLGQRIVSPSMSLTVINQRLDLVQELLEQPALREDIRKLLKDTSDTSRLLQKFSIGKGEAEDMLGIARTIQLTESLHKTLWEHKTSRELHNVETNESPSTLASLDDILNSMTLEAPSQLAKSIFTAIDEANVQQKHMMEIEKAEHSQVIVEEVEAATEDNETPLKLARKMLKDNDTKVAEEIDIWIMRKTASPALRTAHENLQQLLDKKKLVTADLRARYGVESLVLKWTPKYGHYLYAKGKDATKLRGGTKAARGAPVYDSIWTSLGQEVDRSKDRIRAEEERVFIKLKAHVFENLLTLRRNAAVLDELDVACSSAVAAKERHLVRPTLNDSRMHNIVGGRHPTVDVSLFTQGRRFTTNDCIVGDNQLIHLITGPNMGGKSTYLRQNALITILAQTGCFVPAQYAELGLVDRIFSRVGSADSLHQDQSTFMVEMLETAEILRQATPRSFVIMDEIGRGTTPEDGVAVGYACLHHLHYTNQCRSLFATHFHALADMTEDFDRLHRFCTDVAEDEDGSWIYVHKLQPGVNRKSHALKVARMAGLPEQAIETAAKVLESLSPQSEPHLAATAA